MILTRPGVLAPACRRAQPQRRAVRYPPGRPPAANQRARHVVAGGAATELPQSAPQAAPSSSRSDGRTLILAVDDSSESRHALRWALQHLHRPGDVMRLVHCVPALPPGRLVAVQGAGLLRVPRVDPQLVAEKAAADAGSTLGRRFLSQLEKAGVQGSFEVLRGPPADAKTSISAALSSRATQEAAAAVIIASASRGGLREALLGSVAANLAHTCEVPVVVLHKPREATAGGSDSDADADGDSSSGGAQHDVAWLLRASTQDILGAAMAKQVQPEAQQQQQQQAQQAQQAARNLVVAVDDSDEGYAAVAWALQHLWRPGDVMHLLHVVPALPAHMSYSLAPDGMLYSLPLPQLEEAQVEEGYWRELLLERVGPLLQARQVEFQLDVLTDYGAEPLQGVAAAVVATAERLGAAALVVCGHCKGTLAEWLLGSVSDYAVHHASVPVVVLHHDGSLTQPDSEAAGVTTGMGSE